MAVRKDRFDGIAATDCNGQSLTVAPGRFGSEVVALDGTQYRSAWGKLLEIAIGSNGAERAVACIRGKHHREDTTDKGHRPLPVQDYRKMKRFRCFGVPNALSPSRIDRQ